MCVKTKKKRNLFLKKKQKTRGKLNYTDETKQIKKRNKAE